MGGSFLPRGSGANQPLWSWGWGAGEGVICYEYETSGILLTPFYQKHMFLIPRVSGTTDTVCQTEWARTILSLLLLPMMAPVS